MEFDKDMLRVSTEKVKQEEARTRKAEAEAKEAELRLEDTKQQGTTLDEILRLVQDIHGHVT